MSKSPEQQKVVITTAADSGYFDMFQGMIHSIRSFDSGRDLDICCFNLGFKDEERAWLEKEGVILADPQWHMGLTDGVMPYWHLAEIVRPYVRDYFPGYDHYMWLDPDLWLQNGGVLDRLVDGSREVGCAIAHESDRAYKFQPWLFGWNLKHKILGLGVKDGLTLMVKQYLNCGVYCVAADAPHWDMWIALLKKAVDATNRVAPHSQFTFNQMYHCKKLPMRILDAGDNWICDRAPPVWDEETKLYCKPYAPFEPLALLHLAGPAKRRNYTIKTTTGQSREDVSLRYALPNNVAAAA